MPGAVQKLLVASRDLVGKERHTIVLAVPSLDDFDPPDCIEGASEAPERAPKPYNYRRLQPLLIRDVQAALGAALGAALFKVLVLLLPVCVCACARVCSPYPSLSNPRLQALCVPLSALCACGCVYSIDVACGMWRKTERHMTYAEATGLAGTAPRTLHPPTHPPRQGQEAESTEAKKLDVIRDPVSGQHVDVRKGGRSGSGARDLAKEVGWEKTVEDALHNPAKHVADVHRGAKVLLMPSMKVVPKPALLDRQVLAVLAIERHKQHGILIARLTVTDERVGGAQQDSRGAGAASEAPRYTSSDKSLASHL